MPDNISKKALGWIVTNYRTLAYLQSDKVPTPALGALLFAEMSEEYYRKFKRELVNDLNTLAEEAEHDDHSST